MLHSKKICEVNTFDVSSRKAGFPFKCEKANFQWSRRPSALSPQISRFMTSQKFSPYFDPFWLKLFHVSKMLTWKLHNWFHIDKTGICIDSFRKIVFSKYKKSFFLNLEKYNFLFFKFGKIQFSENCWHKSQFCWC